MRSTLCSMFVLLGPSLLLAQPTAEKLAAIQTTVAPEGERKALANMLADSIRARQREANSRSSAEWQAIRNRTQWEAFIQPKIRALRDSLGTFPEPKKPRVRVSSTVSGDGFHIDNILYESRPGLWVSANLYRPANPTPAMPGIVIIHAHHTPKEHGELQDMGMTWARAGCLVLVPDMLGHGERRQHPLVDASSYSKPFRVSRQDYYFRFDTAMQLHLAGESLMGWMVWDVWRGVDLLLNQPGCDAKRIILLGSVAGGGDPCAVAAALDDRIAAAVPFNFGGPQPETRYPLPDDAEATFNYMGGGSWESTRNLRLSARDGFLPWVIVGSIAPRRLVYAHEFQWDRERDPVWKRLQTIYGFYGVPDHLASSSGRGSVRGNTPEDTHCTHIGPVQRRAIHEAFRNWFKIDAHEYRQRVPAERLKCWTPELVQELQPKTLGTILDTLVEERLVAAKRRRNPLPIAQSQTILRSELASRLGGTEPGPVSVRNIGVEASHGIQVERVLIQHESGIVVPFVVLSPLKSKSLAVVIAIAQAGKAKLLQERAKEFSHLLEQGIAICLPDVRGTGETSPGSGRGRTSAATSLSSSLLMHGETLIGGQLRDLRAVAEWIRKSDSTKDRAVFVWGDSLQGPRQSSELRVVPRDDDATLPPCEEPMGGLLALLCALEDPEIRGVILRKPISNRRDALKHQQMFLPHDVIVPGWLTITDVDELTAGIGNSRVLKVDLESAASNFSDWIKEKSAGEH